MSSKGDEEGQQPAAYYGTFQPTIGFPQPTPPPGFVASNATYFPHGYQSVPAYAGGVVAEGTPVNVFVREREPRLPCCGLGFGWFLFIIGFFLASIPWYFGAFIVLCTRVDYREKPGYIACTVAAIVAAIVIILGVSRGADDW